MPHDPRGVRGEGTRAEIDLSERHIGDTGFQAGSNGEASQSAPIPEPTHSVAKPLLEIDALEVCFYTRRGVVQATRTVSLAVERGQTVGLVGESGSGKTVLAQTILGLVQVPGRITGGDIR